MLNNFTINGDKYSYEDVGSGDVVVLFHGFTGSRKTWSELIIFLKREYRVISIDLPGHGYTETNEHKSVKGFCTDMYHLFEELNINKVHLLGYSMGGRTALSFALYYPEMVSSLILESASPGIADPKLKRERRIADAKLAASIVNFGVIDFVNQWEKIDLFKSQLNLPANIKRIIREERLNQSKEGLSASLLYMGTGIQPSWWDKLNTVSIPVTLIVGELDEKFVLINEQMKELFKNVNLYTIKEAGHCVHLEKTNEFNEQVRISLRKYSE